MSETASEIRDLQKQVARMRRVFLFIISLALLVLMFVNLPLVIILPKMERVCGEFIIPMEKLPDLSKWVFSYGRGLGRCLTTVLITVVPLLTITFLLVFRGSPKVLMLAGIVALLLIAHWMIVSLATLMPVIMIFQQIKAG